MSIDLADPVYQLWLAYRGSVSRSECQAKIDQFVLDGRKIPAEIVEVLQNIVPELLPQLVERATLLEVVENLALLLRTAGISNRELAREVESLREDADCKFAERFALVNSEHESLRATIEAVQRAHEDTRARLAEYVERERRRVLEEASSRPIEHIIGDSPVTFIAGAMKSPTCPECGNVGNPADRCRKCGYPGK